MVGASAETQRSTALSFQFALRRSHHFGVFEGADSAGRIACLFVKDGKMAPIFGRSVVVVEILLHLSQGGIPVGSLRFPGVEKIEIWRLERVQIRQRERWFYGVQSLWKVAPDCGDIRPSTGVVSEIADDGRNGSEGKPGGFARLGMSELRAAAHQTKRNRKKEDAKGTSTRISTAGVCRIAEGAIIHIPSSP